MMAMPEQTYDPLAGSRWLQSLTPVRTRTDGDGGDGRPRVHNFHGMTPALAARAYERVLNRADLESHAREQIPVATAIDDPMPPQTTPARPPEQEMPPAPTQAAPTVPAPVPPSAPTPPGDRDSADEDIQHLMATPHNPPAPTTSVPSTPDPAPASVSPTAPSTGPAQPAPAEPTSVDAPTTSGPEPTQRPVDPEIARKYPYLFGYNSDNGVPAQVGSLPWIIAQTEEKKSSQADATTVEQTLIGQVVLGTGPAAPRPAASSALELIIPEAAIPSIASDVNSADPLPSGAGVPDPRATGLPDSIRDPRVLFRIGAGYPASQLIADLETIRVPPVPWVGQGAHPWDAAMARLQAAAYTPPQQLEDLKSATSDTLPCLRNEAAWYTEARQQQERQQREARRRLDEAGIPWRGQEISEYVRYLATIPVLTSPSEPVDSDPELSLGGVARQLGHMAVGIFAMTDFGAVVNSVGGWLGRHPNLPTSDDVAAGIAAQVEAAKVEADRGNTAGVVNHVGMAIGLPDWRDPNSVVAFGIAVGAFGGAAGRGKPGSGGVDAVGSPAVASGAGRVNRNPAGWTDHIDIYSHQTQISPSHVGKPPAPHDGLPPIHSDAVPKTPIEVIGSDQPQRRPVTAIGRNEEFKPIAPPRYPGEIPWTTTPKGPTDRARGALLEEIDPSGPRVGVAGELIETIDGLPVVEYIAALAKQRAIVIGAESKSVGPVYAAAIDLRYGRITEGVNGSKRSLLETHTLHPLLRQNYVDIAVWQHLVKGEHGIGIKTYDGKVHADHPLRHAEVKAINELLWAREVVRRPGDPALKWADLEEFRFDPRWLREGKGYDKLDPAPACANCNAILRGIPSYSGRYRYDPIDSRYDRARPFGIVER